VKKGGVLIWVVLLVALAVVGIQLWHHATSTTLGV
jgi:hypothetical protein